MRQYAPPKRQSASTRLHGVFAQKDVIFILTAVRTWNLTLSHHFRARRSRIRHQIHAILEEAIGWYFFPIQLFYCTTYNGVWIGLWQIFEKGDCRGLFQDAKPAFELKRSEVNNEKVSRASSRHSTDSLAAGLQRPPPVWEWATAVKMSNVAFGVHETFTKTSVTIYIRECRRHNPADHNLYLYITADHTPSNEMGRWS
jgi:hypothetical protein